MCVHSYILDDYRFVCQTGMSICIKNTCCCHNLSQPFEKCADGHGLRGLRWVLCEKICGNLPKRSGQVMHLWRFQVKSLVSDIV